MVGRKKTMLDSEHVGLDGGVMTSVRQVSEIKLGEKRKGGS